MLTHLNIHNFAIAENVETDFHAGMTVITGETGAGKSILLDAIGLALGDRADSGSIGPFGDKTQINACFDISENKNAQAWLSEHELESGDVCVLRRVLKKDGKSKAFINNNLVTVNAAKDIGELLIDIHGQHAHQSLLHSNHQRHILDEYGQHSARLKPTNAAFKHWQALQKKYDTITANAADANTRARYLKFQLDEMHDVVISANEVNTLNQEQQVLANAEAVTQHCLQATSAISDEGKALSLIRQSINDIKALPLNNDALDEAIELLESACIQTEEASKTIQQVGQGVEIDEQRLAIVDAQLNSLHVLARKHTTSPELLIDRQQELQTELEATAISEADLETLATEIEAAKAVYMQAASALTRARKKTAIKLKATIEKHLAALSMANCRIEFCLEEAEPSALGLEKIKLCLASNPGQALQALNKTASGGELSRIGLAIQVATAQINAVPVMIFDEVDSGVGGGVAEVVGNLMRQLSEQRQVFCVTHLAQVASKAHNHYQVSKVADKTNTTTHLQELSETQRVNEIARMLGGLTITEQTLAHAQEMLNNKTE